MASPSPCVRERLKEKQKFSQLMSRNRGLRYLKWSTDIALVNRVADV